MTAAMRAALAATPSTGRITAGQVWAWLDQVPDPEIPVISIVDLGIVRKVELLDGGGCELTITPTYSGCPATAAINLAIRQKLDEAGFGEFSLITTLAPAWTTDWISPAGRAKLKAFGISPPPEGAGQATMRPGEAPACPRCNSPLTEEISRFGSTPCKALWRCLSCLEPFDRFKCH